MSKKQDQLRKKFEALQKGIPQSLLAKVKAVSDETCTVDYEGLTLYKVKLRASENEEKSQFVLKPEVGSYVVISRIQHSANFYVSMLSEVASIQMRTGEFKGLVKVEDLVTRLNSVEKDLNDLKTAYQSWTSVAQDGGMALRMAIVGTPSGPALPTAWAGKTIEETEVSDLENEKITHG